MVEAVGGAGTWVGTGTWIGAVADCLDEVEINEVGQAACCWLGTTGTKVSVG